MRRNRIEERKEQTAERCVNVQPDAAFRGDVADRFDRIDAAVRKIRRGRGNEQGLVIDSSCDGYRIDGARFSDVNNADPQAE